MGDCEDTIVGELPVVVVPKWTSETSCGRDYDISLENTLRDHFGDSYFDPTLDRISVSIVAMRTGEQPERLLKEIVKKLTACRVFKTSGCWLSKNKSMYRTTAKWKYGGLKPVELFSHDGRNNERHVVRHDPNIQYSRNYSTIEVNVQCYQMYN